ncbi:FLOT1 protein, partial [Arenaria interpres]|nr:FLOT1 protein [Arenaria interpres]
QEIYKDRQKFSEQVFNVASSDLVNMGISVVSYTLKDIHDDQVAPGGGQRGDSVGTRVSLWTSTMTWAGHQRVGTRGHSGDKGVNMVRYTLKDIYSDQVAPGSWEGYGHHCGVPYAQVARTKQQIEEQRAQVLVVERAQQAQLQEHEIGRRERELEATIRKPAEAERYRLERLAEAQR